MLIWAFLYKYFLILIAPYSDRGGGVGGGNFARGDFNRPFQGLRRHLAGGAKLLGRARGQA